MSKVAIASILSERMGLTKAQGLEAVDIMLDGIGRVLVSRQRIMFVGFGSFHLHERQRRRSHPDALPQVVTEVTFTTGDTLQGAIEEAYPPREVDPSPGRSTKRRP